MRSSSTANKSPAERRALRDLGAIRRSIAPLSPPVASFAASIRSTPFRILVSVLLSSRTQDPVTEKAATRLFAVADTPGKMGKLTEKRIARLIHPVGFYRTKARHILGVCAALESRRVFPASRGELLELPGIGRKSANLVLALAFRRPAIAVDTHVFRISRRLGWAQGRRPAEVEMELQRLFPRRRWKDVNQVVVGFGQTICRPVHPKCGECVLQKTCPAANSVTRNEKEKSNCQNEKHNAW